MPHRIQECSSDAKAACKQNTIRVPLAEIVIAWWFSHRIRADDARTLALIDGAAKGLLHVLFIRNVVRIALRHDQEVSFAILQGKPDGRLALVGVRW